MRIHTITPYMDGQHGKTFHILTEDSRHLLATLEIIGRSPALDYFSVDDCDGFDFYDNIHYEVWGVLPDDTLRPSKIQEKK